VAAHDVPEAEIRFRTSRSGGPGGQNVNKVETRVEAVWDLDGSAAFTDAQKARIRSELRTRVGADGTIRVVSQRHRSQSRNREAAIERLRALVAHALRPRRKRKATRPTQAARAGTPDRLVVTEAFAGRAEFAGYDQVVVNPAEAYAANCVRVNEQVLVAAGYAAFEEKLRELGYKTMALEMSEFQKMDGGLSCLSLRF